MLPRARIKDSPEDFVVEEIPAYLPSGEGDHLFVRFTKRDRTTDDAVRAICRAVGCDPRDAGVAGMKDKRAVTTQTLSLPIPPKGRGELTERVEGLALDGIQILSAQPHTNKLKTGHLAGNRFAIAVRGIERERLGEVTSALEKVGRDGLPNAFGQQRFGRDRDNADRARAWLSGRAPPPRDPRLRRFLWSALQAELFNAVLSARVEDGTWATPLLGDLVKRRTSGGLFLCTDVQVDRERAARGEVCPTGPVFGLTMRQPEGEPAALEQRILEEKLGQGVDLTKTRGLGEGTRRPLRLWVDELRVEPLEPPGGEQETGVRVYFVLPKGSYATTVLASAVAWDPASEPDPPA